MSKLRERNLKVIKKVLTGNDDYKSLRENLNRRHKVDITDEAKFPVLSESWSWKKLKNQLVGKLNEADAASAYVQFLRAGVQNITNAAYEAVATTFEDWVTVVQSTKDTELYAPLHGVAFPRQVGPSEKYPEVGSAALDIKLQNRKFGSMYVIQRELLEDDQTGQFQKQASMMGEYMKLLTEVLVYGKLASASNMQYLDYSVPVSETKPSSETTYPWSTALQGGGKNRPATFGAFNQANIQNGFIALMGQKNLLGILMSVNPNRLVVSPRNIFDAQVLLNSAYYPSGAAAAGATGGAFSINPIKSIADLTVSRYLFDSTGTANPDSKSWYLMDDSKPWFILQQREAATVEQEANNAGKSFEQDEMRFKVRGRMNADFIDPRFAWQGNDGTV